MKHALVAWWQARAPRERLLIGIAAALALSLFAWLAVARPLAEAAAESRLRQARAVEMLGAARAAAAGPAARTRPAAAPLPQPLDRFVAASAEEAGFTDAAVSGGPGEARVAIGSARAQAFLDWVARLEQRGARVVALKAVPNAAGNTLSVEVAFARDGA